MASVILSVSVTSCDQSGSVSKSDSDTKSILSALYLFASSGNESNESTGDLETPESLALNLRDAPAQGLFVAAGNLGFMTTSSDGLTWDTGLSISDYDLFAVTFGDNILVAVGESGKMHTYDGGASWTSQGKQNDRLRDIFYADNHFVAVGEGGRRASSHDGFNWTNDSVSGSNLYAVSAAEILEDPSDPDSLNTAFVAGGFKGRITRSFTDGASWKEFALTTASDIYDIIPDSSASFF
jgi:photosystem II stability/assembly factor-like uncharacterized protein